VFGGVYIVLIITVITIPFHDLYYVSLTLHQNPFPHVATTSGPIRGLGVGYLSGGIVLGTYYLGSLFQNTRRQLGASTIILAVAVLLGLIPFVASELDYTPIPSYNHTTFAVSVFILGVSYSVYRHSFYDLAPVGRATLIDVIDDPMVVLDTELRLVDYNPAATRIVSDLTEERIGTPLQAVHSKLATVVADAERDEETELALPVTGETRTFSVLVSDITVASESEGYVLFLRDITTLRDRERELQRQNERLDRFASTVSHDLRNPLNVARGRLELAQRDTESEHFAPIENAHERMELLIDDLLTLARSDQTVEETDLVALADVASDAWAHTDMDDCRFDSSIPATTRLEADRDRLLHVFENLYRNAVDHNDPPLTVRVGLIAASDSSTDDDQSTGFFIEDNGTGIPEER
jgi:signal transduction histidine kinase